MNMKILLQRVWELGAGWDEPVPVMLLRSGTELSILVIHLCYLPNDVNIVSTQLHSSSNASENVYAGVICLQMSACLSGHVKTKGLC